MALSDRLPLFDELCSRAINFYYSWLKSLSKLISNLVKYPVSDDGAQSPHGRNIRYLCIVNLIWNTGLLIVPIAIETQFEHLQKSATTEAIG